MLQQTTVAAVAGRYSAFLERFPSAAAMARASESEVLDAAQGLGYYRRFRHLKRAAERIAERHGGVVPGTRAALAELPGVGPYMSGAILSIAFELPEAAVDGNVVRVLARFLCKGGDLLRPAARRDLEAFVRAMMSGQSPGAVTQALFDLGATVCTPAAPSCLVCPLRERCAAAAAGQVALYPEKKKRREPVDVHVAAACIRREDTVLLVRRPEDASLMPGFWETPTVWADDREAARRRLDEELAGRYGLAVVVGDVLATSRHAITHHRLDCRLYATTIARGAALRASPELAWVDAGPAPKAPGPLTTVTRKLLSAAFASGGRRRARSPK